MRKTLYKESEDSNDPGKTQAEMFQDRSVENNSQDVTAKERNPALNSAQGINLMQTKKINIVALSD